jgi:protein-tyrosine phosphatase
MSEKRRFRLLPTSHDWEDDDTNLGHWFKGDFAGLLRTPSSPKPPNTSKSHPIRIDWIDPGRTGTPGKLGMTLCPGRKGPGRSADFDRDLREDLHRIANHWEVATIVPLIELFEFKMLKIPRYHVTADEVGLDVVWYPIQDGGTPKSIPKTRRLINYVIQRLRYGHNVVFHCKAGLGRAGTMAASTLVRLGYQPSDAITVVRSARKGAIENSNQERFVQKFRGKEMSLPWEEDE